ncbi:MAG: lactonase family protein [Bacteroidota bacterium]|nr:lactonase family protein [Bacteroidota bacterium]
MKKIIVSFIAFLFLHTSWSQESYLITGTYTGGKSEGVYVYKFNSNNGSYKEISHVKTSNPSFVAISPDQKFVYAVHEDAAGKGKGGEISAFSFHKESGTLRYINEQPTEGDHPCYVEVDKTGKWVIAANYTSGSLSVLPVKEEGGLGEPVTTIRHEGSSVNKERQSGPHVHCTLLSADNRYLFVPDLGIDKVMIYEFDAETGKLTPAAQPFAKSIDGSGPRHFTFHPNNKYAYLVEELSGTVETFQYKNGSLKNIQRISTMPAGDTSFAGSADIHVSPDGKFLYASNRSLSNTIAIFKIDPNDGRLALIGHQSTLGKTPRNFNFDPSGNFLLVANQDSDQVVIFKRDKETGLLADTGKRIDVGKPVCLKWVLIY